MRARDARDLARLAQDALRSLPVLAVEPEIALRHLVRALRSEAARKRPARRPADEPEQPAPVGRIADARFVWDDPGIGSITATREPDPEPDAFLADLVTTSHGVRLSADGCRELARWLLAVADDERRPT